MADWRKLAKAALLADGKIDDVEVKLLRKELFADGKIDADEVKFLIDLRNTAQKRAKAAKQTVNPKFEALFFKAIEANVLQDGKIDAAEARWLRGMLFADQVIVQFSNGQVTEGTAIGSPAYFEQPRTESRRPVHGHADRIIYDAKKDTVRLYGHAQLAEERKLEISAPVLEYNIRDERSIADSPGERRGVHATIIPQ